MIFHARFSVVIKTGDSRISDFYLQAATFEAAIAVCKQMCASASLPTSLLFLELVV